MTYRGFITREQWGARSPRSRSLNISPIGQLTHWMGGRVGHISHDGCYSYVRSIQRYHMDNKGWVDIAYTLMPCRHGYIFAGRGKGVRTAANGTNTANYRYHANALLIGQGDTPTADLVDAHWAGYKMLGGGEHKSHRDFRSTSCPGDWAYDMARRGPQRAITTTPSGSEEDAEMLDTNSPDGPAVTYYQKALLGFDPNCLPEYGADGNYGSETEKAVKAYQRAAGLPETGVIGDITSTLLARYHPEWKGVRGKTVGAGGGAHTHVVTGSLDVVGSTALGKEIAKHLNVGGKLSTGEAG